MKWQEFSRTVAVDQCSQPDSSSGTISQLISHRGDVEAVLSSSHKWYPKGIKNAESVSGHRYVDMHHSYCGEDAILISEANCCVIVVLLDTMSNMRFAAHIAACSDMKSKHWLRMKFDLQCFFKKINFDISRTESFLFSNRLYKNGAGSFEQKNVMRLFMSALNPTQLKQMASKTYFIEGEGGQMWNHYCAVRLGENSQQISISLAH